MTDDVFLIKYNYPYIFSPSSTVFSEIYSVYIVLLCKYCLLLCQLFYYNYIFIYTYIYS